MRLNGLERIGNASRAGREVRLDGDEHGLPRPRPEIHDVFWQ
jgi:hypothetical protein